MHLMLSFHALNGPLCLVVITVSLRAAHFKVTRKFCSSIQIYCCLWDVNMETAISHKNSLKISLSLWWGDISEHIRSSTCLALPNAWPRESQLWCTNHSFIFPVPLEWPSRSLVLSCFVHLAAYTSLQEVEEGIQSARAGHRE